MAQRTLGDKRDEPAAGLGRKAEIVQGAYALIAEKGFEGLRTRDVANRAGINVATLHYYFPTKEGLIQGVVEHLMRELQASRVPLKDSASAFDRLRAEFRDIRIRLKKSPEQLIVLTELAVRAFRDPAIARILRYLDEGWSNHLRSIFKAGIREGAFRANLDVEAAANTMMAQLRGLGYQGILETRKLDQLVSHIAAQTEYSIRAYHR